MTLRVYNLVQPLVDRITGTILQPWNSFFQQFTQAPGQSTVVDVTASPFTYTAKEPGQLLIGDDGNINSITMTRGRVSTVTLIKSGLYVLEIGDGLTIDYVVKPTVYFFSRY